MPPATQVSARARNVLEDKEFSLIQEIARDCAQTQRELSLNTGLSLGMTNILLKRLAHKGYIKVTHLDWKRTRYLLTMKGLLEKTRKSYAYALYARHVGRTSPVLRARATKRNIMEILGSQCDRLQPRIRPYPRPPGRYNIIT